MKTITKKPNILKTAMMLAVLYLGLNHALNAQCGTSFTLTTGSSSVDLTSTSWGTATSNYYNWTLSGTENRNVISSGPSYTFNQLYNGTYTVSLSIDPTVCPGVATQTFSINGSVDPPTCSTAFTYTVGSAGTVSFTNTSPNDDGLNGNPVASSFHSWSFGDRTAYIEDSTTITTSFTHTYYYNGTYTVNLHLYNKLTGCSSSSTQTISITNANPLPPCNSSFTYTLGAAGQVSFTSLYAGTAPDTVYYWDFGNNTYGSFKNSTVTYPYNGTYSVTLYAIDSVANCNSSTTHTLTISGGVNAPACSSGFTYTVGASGTVNFTNTSPADPLSNTTYTLSFGDGSEVSSTALNLSHTYQNNGIYHATLYVSNPLAGCYTSSTQTISIANNPVTPCTSNFSINPWGQGGQFNFIASYTGNANSISWDFGDGNHASNTANTWNTYLNSGTYSVTLTINDPVTNCFSTTTQTIQTIPSNTPTVSCIPSANFTMYKLDSIAVGTWGISPNYSPEVTSAVWYWGDGTSTPGFYPNHLYASAGAYNICVTVFSACGDSANVCQQENLYRLSSMIQVNVINATADIKSNKEESAQLDVYPNPSNGLLMLNISNASDSKAQISITNILGELVYNAQESISNNTLAKEINLQSAANGAYFMKVMIGNKAYTNKIIINK